MPGCLLWGAAAVASGAPPPADWLPPPPCAPQVDKVAQQLRKGSGLWGLLTSPLALVGCVGALLLRLRV